MSLFSLMTLHKAYDRHEVKPITATVVVFNIIMKKQNQTQQELIGYNFLLRHDTQVNVAVLLNSF